MLLHKTQLLIKCLTLLIILFFCGSESYSQNEEKALKERGKKFIEEVAKIKYNPDSVAGAIDTLFRQHVSTSSGCGLVNTSLLPQKLPYVPKEIIDSSPMMKETGESLVVNGQNLFWYVYKADQITTVLSAPPDINRFLVIPSSLENEVVASPSRIFPSWIMVRNCTGYLNGATNASGKFFTVSASAAVKADAQQKSSIALIAGTFKSPIVDILSKGKWKARLINLGVWNIYKNDATLIDNAWYMNNFQGVMVSRKADVNRTFDAKTELEGSASFTIASVTAKLNAGLALANQFTISDFKTVIVSDVKNQTSRNSRFSKLPSVKEITDEFAVADVIPEDTGDNNPLLKNTSHTHKQTIEGIPESVCNSGWELVDIKAGVFKASPAPKVRFNFESRTDATNRTEIPTCVFSITGTPEDSLFPAAGTVLPPAIFKATLRSRDSLPGGKYLERVIEQSIPTSNQPILRVISTDSVKFAAEPQDDDTFKLIWRDIIIDFDDAVEPIDRRTGTTSVPDSVLLKCGDYKVNGVATIGSDRRYHLEIVAEQTFSTTEYESGTSASTPCVYESNFPVQLARIGNPQIRRSLTLKLRFPKKKTLNPIPTPTVTPAPTVTPTPVPATSPAPISTP